MQTNKQIYNELSEYVADEFFSDNDSLKNIEFGPMEVNYFSVCFWLKSTVNAKEIGCLRQNSQTNFI